MWFYVRCTSGNVIGLLLSNLFINDLPLYVPTFIFYVHRQLWLTPNGGQNDKNLVFCLSGNEIPNAQVARGSRFFVDVNLFLIKTFIYCKENSFWLILVLEILKRVVQCLDKTVSVLCSAQTVLASCIFLLR